MKHGAKIRGAVLLLFFCVPFSTAQTLRDPTIPPAEAGLQPAAEAAGTSPEREPMTVVMRNGKPYVMWGVHLLAPGATLDGKRLEKITETEIWLRDGKQRLKVPRFVSDIQIRPASP